MWARNLREGHDWWRLAGIAIADEDRRAAVALGVGVLWHRGLQDDADHLEDDDAAHGVASDLTRAHLDVVAVIAEDRGQLGRQRRVLGDGDFADLEDILVPHRQRMLDDAGAVRAHAIGERHRKNALLRVGTQQNHSGVSLSCERVVAFI